MQIKPLTHKTLDPALKLLYSVFHNSPKDDDYPGKWIHLSLKSEPDSDLWRKFGLLELKYYVALNGEKVIGIVGYYAAKKYKGSYWLGWFCVDPKYRNKGIGAKLLQRIIRKTKRDKKKFLKLYTYAKGNERNAFRMYKKFGFKKIGTIMVNREEHMILELRV